MSLFTCQVRIKQADKTRFDNQLIAAFHLDQDCRCTFDILSCRPSSRIYKQSSSSSRQAATELHTLKDTQLKLSISLTRVQQDGRLSCIEPEMNVEERCQRHHLQCPWFLRCKPKQRVPTYQPSCCCLRFCTLAQQDRFGTESKSKHCWPSRLLLAAVFISQNSMFAEVQTSSLRTGLEVCCRCRLSQDNLLRPEDDRVCKRSHTSWDNLQNTHACPVENVKESVLFRKQSDKMHR